MKKIISIIIVSITIFIALAIATAIIWRYTPLQDGDYSVVNKHLNWRLNVTDGVLTTIAIENKYTKEILKVEGHDFALRIGHASTLGYQSSMQRATDKWPPYAALDGQVVTPQNCRAVLRIRSFKKEKFVLYSPDLQCNIYLEFDKSSNNSWLERKISLQGCDPKVELVIDQKAQHVEWKFDGQTELGGKGQPLFLNNKWFMALAHPWSDNTCAKGIIKLTQYPGTRFTNNVVQLNSMVMGGGTESSGRSLFNDYFKTFRRKPRSLNLYNSWNDLRRKTLTDKNILSSATKIQKELKQRGSSLGYSVVDDGWQNHKSIWQTNTKQLPGDFKALSQELDQDDIKLGVWLSLSGFFIDSKWAKNNGYEPPNNVYLCLSQPKYNQALRQALTSLVLTGRVSYFKHDFNYFACGRPGHGHFLNGDMSIEYNINEEIDILKYERKLNPDIYQAITSGINPSPWWFQYVDTIWMGGSDQSYDQKTPVSLGSSKEMNYRDGALYKLFETKKLILPLYGIMTHGIVDGKHAVYNMTKESNESWDNYAMNYFGRGTMMRELYFSPELITSNRWNTIARGLEWASSLDNCFENSHLFLGNPSQGELYGYTGKDKDRRYISVRNPAIGPVESSFKELLLTNEIVEVIYPYHQYLLGNQTSNIQIEGEMVFQAETYLKSSLTRPVPVGIRSKLLSYGEDFTEYALYPNHINQKIEIVSPIVVNAVEGLDATKKNDKSWLVKLANSPELSAWPEVNNYQSLGQGSFDMTVAQAKDLKSTLKVLDYSRQQKLKILVNNKKPKIKTMKGADWRVLTLNCGAVTNNISCKYSADNSFAMESYLIAERELPELRIKIKHPKAEKPKTFRLLAPLRQNLERKIESLPQKASLSNKVFLIKSNNIEHQFNSVISALKKTSDSDKVVIMPGTYIEKNYASDWIMHNKNNVEIIGVENPTIRVFSKKDGYQIGLQLPNNQNLKFEGITLENMVDVSNNHIVYNGVFTGCKNLMVSNCIFRLVINGTNNVAKNFVAVNCDNVRVSDCTIETIDKNSGNDITQIATHDSKDNITFLNCTLLANNPKNICLGPGRFVDCHSNMDSVVNGAKITKLE